MAMKAKVVKAFNEQINKEFYSSYLYLAMAAWAEDEDLPGLANWMRVQAQEEISHGMILFNFVAERGGRVVLDKIDKPTTNFKNLVDVFQQTLKHEEFVTESINDLMALAEKEKDFASRNRLEWFVEEQVEEEANAGGLLATARRIGNHGEGLIMLDKELSGRAFNLPGPLAGGE